MDTRTPRGIQADQRIFIDTSNHGSSKAWEAYEAIHLGIRNNNRKYASSR